MELHNTTEDLILGKIEDIFSALEGGENQEELCTCQQCRLDTACYVLNRTQPHYIVSNRGAARVNHESLESQQREADMTALIYEGLKRVNHNQRPSFTHTSGSGTKAPNSGNPVFNIPTIVGRLFDGSNFAPVFGVKVELFHLGELVIMKDSNWQNPYSLVANIQGTFTFWPAPLPADNDNIRKVFEYAIRVISPEYETLNHYFKIPVISEIQTANSFTLNRTFKLPDQYLFPPGEAEKNGFQD
jgi:competence protein ComFB